MVNVPAVEQEPGATPSQSLNTKEMRRILASSFIGSTIEYYDFILYATAAAIVFNQVFFAGMGPEFATVASFSTLAAGYIMRPLGGIFFGHFGDRMGRKTVLIVSMMLMGVATTLIGLLPGYAQIGVAAPVLLVALRIVQGFAVGGEWGGAMLVALEHAPDKKRGFAASFANMGAPAGAVLASLAVSLFTLLPREQFISWGWRVPFLLSVFLVLIGLVIRYKVSETPVFKELEAKAAPKRIPLFEVLATHPKDIILGVLAGMSIYTMAGIVTVWAVSYAVDAGANATWVLNAKAFAALGSIGATIVGAKLSDRFGRRPVLLAGVLAAAVFAFPILWLVGFGTAWSYAAAVLLGQVIQGLISGPFGAFVAELFPTRMRYTGASLTYQSASTFGAGFTPAIAATLVAVAAGSFWLLGAVWVLVLLIAAAAVFLSSEGRQRELASIT